MVDGNGSGIYLCFPFKTLKMKRFILVSILAIGVLSSQAQVSKMVQHVQKHGAFGVKAGLNLSDLSAGQTGEEFSSPKMRLGLVLGAFYNIPLGERFAFQPELSWSAEGANQDGKLGANNTMVLVAEYKYKYLNVPLMLQYQPSRFYLEAGPQLGFLTSAKQTLHTFTNAGDVTTDVKGQMKGTNLSLALGAGYYFGKHLGVGARYAIGLTDVRTVSGAAQKGSVLSFSLLYKF
jgi:outer membrane immunogenic protein